MVLFLESMLNITLLFPVHAKSNCRNKKCSGVRCEELYDCMCNILTSSYYSLAKYYCFVYESLQAHSQEKLYVLHQVYALKTRGIVENMRKSKCTPDSVYMSIKLEFNPHIMYIYISYIFLYLMKKYVHTLYTSKIYHFSI